RAGRFAGAYQFTRRNYTRLERIASLGNEVAVSVDQDGYLVLSGPEGANAYVETAPLTFRDIDSDNTIAFRENEDGEITHLFVSGFTDAAFERIAPLQTAQTFNLILGLAGFLSLTTLIAAWSRRFQKRGDEPSAPARYAAWSAIVAALSAVATIGVLTAEMAGAANAGLSYLLVWPSGMIIASQWLAALFALATAGALAGLPASWSLIGGRNGWPISRRLHYTLFAGAAALMLAVMWMWNLIGFKY
ncbi:MAG: hypothetical protein K2P58_05140, partial [Hyphomonadaceae bacterium]|nr:hypothetical protein [Hyphomonadaceae bacterium]